MQDSYGIFICQRRYATVLLKKVEMKNYKAIKTPMNVNEKLSLNYGAEKVKEKHF